MNDLTNDGAVDDALECSSVPWFPLSQLSRLHTTVRERASDDVFLTWMQLFLDIRGLLYACSRLTQLLVLHSFICFESPTRTLKVTSGTVVSSPLMFQPWEDRLTPPLNTTSIQFQRGTVRHSFPGPFKTAQPEFFCCKTKLTMLFYIYVFVYTCNVLSCMYVWVWDLWFYPWYAWSMA